MTLLFRTSVGSVIKSRTCGELSIFLGICFRIPISPMQWRACSDLGVTMFLVSIVAHAGCNLLFSCREQICASSGGRRGAGQVRNVSSYTWAVPGRDTGLLGRVLEIWKLLGPGPMKYWTRVISTKFECFFCIMCGCSLVFNWYYMSLTRHFSTNSIHSSYMIVFCAPGSSITHPGKARVKGLGSGPHFASAGRARSMHIFDPGGPNALGCLEQAGA